MAKKPVEEEVEDDGSDETPYQQVVEIQNLLSGVTMDATLRNDLNHRFQVLKAALKG